jgi:pimeloyl-ACP methyl ester carboxylesterase
MAPAVRALAYGFRVVTYSLAGERASGLALTERTEFEVHVGQLDQVFASAGIDCATLCGISYGGLVALRYAAVRPGRVSRLVLASTPGPLWRPDERVGRRDAGVRRAAAAFVAGAPRRLWREISAARPGMSAWRAAAGYGVTVLRYPPSPTRMAWRVRCLRGHDFAADAAAVRAPTLVITGEPDLDRVVPVSGTREYLDAIPRVTGRTLERTGHIGLVTRPEAFAALIQEFAHGGTPA